MGMRPWLDESVVAAALEAVVDGATSRRLPSSRACRRPLSASGSRSQALCGAGRLAGQADGRSRRRCCARRWPPSPAARGSRMRPRPPGSGYPPFGAASVNRVWSCCVIAHRVRAPSASPSGRRSGSGSRRASPTPTSGAASVGTGPRSGVRSPPTADGSAIGPMPPTPGPTRRPAGQAVLDRRPPVAVGGGAGPDPDQEVVPGTDRPPAAPGPSRRSQSGGCLTSRSTRPFTSRPRVSCARSSPPACAPGRARRHPRGRSAPTAGHDQGHGQHLRAARPRSPTGPSPATWKAT